MHATICDYISDMVHNAIEAGANAIILDVNTTGSSIEITISDDGCGMDPDTLASLSDPDTTSKDKHASRKFGLGIPFIQQAIDTCSGTLDIRSEKTVGTSIHVMFPTDNIDTPPLGNMIETWVTLLAYPGQHEITIIRHMGLHTYRLSRHDIIRTIGPLTDTTNLIALKAYMTEQENEQQTTMHKTLLQGA